jgi:hypothetical protein
VPDADVSRIWARLPGQSAQCEYHIKIHLLPHQTTPPAAFPLWPSGTVARISMAAKTIFSELAGVVANNDALLLTTGAIGRLMGAG